MDLEKLKNDCENLVKKALENLQNADEIISDILMVENTIENQNTSIKIYNIILIIKQFLNI